MYKALMIEDHKEVRDFVKEYFDHKEIEVIEAQNGYEGLAILDDTIDIILLDIMMPGMDGIETLKLIRKMENSLNKDTPVIAMTANAVLGAKSMYLSEGFDDYISKPFMPQELLLRVYAVLRRTYKEDSPRVFLDGCTIDFSRAEVNKGGEIIPLTAKEHTLLETLARNEGKIVTVDALCEALWGDNPFGYENSLNAHVRRIREKIEADPSKPVSLITIKGLGYKLITRK